MTNVVAASALGKWRHLMPGWRRSAWTTSVPITTSHHRCLGSRNDGADFGGSGSALAARSAGVPSRRHLRDLLPCASPERLCTHAWRISVSQRGAHRRVSCTSPFTPLLPGFRDPVDNSLCSMGRPIMPLDSLASDAAN